jgi:hypothetical protein
MNVEKIEHDGELLAIVIKYDCKVEGFEVATAPTEILQVDINEISS